MDITVTIDDARAQAALVRYPELLRARIDAALWRGAEEIAREAKGRAPKLFSTLTDSIGASRVEPLHYLVRPGVNYARAVEEGTGPAAKRPRYYPNPDSLLQYLRAAPRMRVFDWARKGSRARGEQELDLWYRSRAFAWWIYQHGTRPQPFMAPAAKAKESRVRQLVEQAVARAHAEMNRG